MIRKYVEYVVECDQCGTSSSVAVEPKTVRMFMDWTLEEDWVLCPGCSNTAYGMLAKAINYIKSLPEDELDSYLFKKVSVILDPAIKKDSTKNWSLATISAICSHHTGCKPVKYVIGSPNKFDVVGFGQRLFDHNPAIVYGGGIPNENWDSAGSYAFNWLLHNLGEN